jgi:serine protease inhibitor ecotin
MEILSSIVVDAVNSALTALTDANNTILPENAPVERAYSKYIFRLEKRSDEDDLLVVISAHDNVIFDCNSHTAPISELLKTSSGYYLIDRPSYASTRMGCPENSLHVERHQVLSTDRILPYNSSAPIVIHAWEYIYVSYEVINKADANNVTSPEPGWIDTPEIMNCTPHRPVDQ